MNVNCADNLIPLNKRTPEERRAIQVKGGSVVGSKKKGLVKRLEWLKKKGLTDETSKYLHDIMTDPEISSLDMRMYLEDIKKNLQNTNHSLSKIQLAKTYIDWHKATHGEKIKSESTSINVNINTTLEEWERRLYDDKME